MRYVYDDKTRNRPRSRSLDRPSLARHFFRRTDSRVCVCTQLLGEQTLGAPRRGAARAEGNEREKESRLLLAAGPTDRLVQFISSRHLCTQSR